MKKTLIAILTFALLITLSFSMSDKLSVKAVTNPEWVGNEVEEKYAFNSTYNLPNVKLNISGTEYDAKTTLEFPDGKATSAKSVILDQAGIYTLRSTVVVNSKTYTTKKEFKVDGLYYVYGNTSYAEYTNNNQSFKDKGIYSYSYNTPKNANYLFVSLGQGDTLTFNEYIDINSLSKSTTDPFIEAFVLPQVVGVYDFDHLYFTLTDSENPNITLTLLVNRVTNNADWARMTTYVMAYGNGQAPTGAEYSGTTINKLHVSDGWGTAFNHSFIKLDSTGAEFDASTQPVRFWFEPKENTVYTRTYGNFQAPVADLDSTDFFGDLWYGFPSGKARLTVTASDFNGSRKANFVIKNIQGLDLSLVKFVDSNAPTITVDTPYDFKNMPEAKINTPYAIPTAKAIDDYDGVRRLNTAVYFNYNTPNQLSICANEESFIPKKIGTYAIVYTASDKNGNVGREVLFVHAGGNIDPININVPSTKETNVILGHTLNVPTPTLTGGSGNLSLKTEIVLNDTKYEITDGTFVPENEGTYRVIYTVTDYNNDVMTSSYDVTTENGTVSLFTDEIVFPKVLCAGQRYTIPEYYLNNYTEGSLKRVKAQVKISDRNGTKTYNGGDEYIPQIIGDKANIKVVFFDSTTSKELTIPAFVPFTQKSETTAAQVQFDRYFNSKEFTKEKTKAGIVFTLTKNQPVASFDFANQIVGSSFRLDFKAFSGSFDSLDIYLEDVLNPLNKVKATIIKNGISGKLVVGDKEIQLLNLFTENGFSILFNKNNEFQIGNAAIKAVLEDGSAFNGFEIEKAYLKVAFNNITKESKFTINRLCGHTFSSALTDTFAPEIVTLGNYGGTYSINDTYKINPVTAFDVFAINVQFTLNVYGPDGEIVKDINGNELRNVNPYDTYYVNLNEFGQYSFAYYAKELDFGPTNLTKSSQLRYIVNVIDKEEPTITVNQETVTYKVGDYISIPTFTVSDNKTQKEDIKVVVYVINPNGVMIKTTKEYIEATQAGTYEIRIMAIDEAGNIALKKIKYTVKEVK